MSQELQTEARHHGTIGRLWQWLGFNPGPENTPEEPSTLFLYRSDQVVGERYRTLAWMMDQLQKKQSFQVLTITSSVAGEGKSTVAANLAAVLAEWPEHTVLLIDFDMRRPRLTELLGGGTPGLKELLEGYCDFESALYYHEELGFSFIPVSSPVEDPLKLLSDPQKLSRTISMAREQFDYVLLDAPPVLPVSDPLFLSEAAEAVLFVVRAGETSGRMLSRSLATLKKEKLLGIVFNGTARSKPYRYERYDKRYSKRT